jgi:hypothetical protein
VPTFGSDQPSLNVNDIIARSKERLQAFRFGV